MGRLMFCIVMSRLWYRQLGILALACFTLFQFPFGSEAKPIRLRTGIISTPARKTAQTAMPAIPTSPASGLFLVQFSTEPTPESRMQLAASGLELLRYIPEDTFVARGHGVQLDVIRALPFVQWVGEYKPEYKISPNLKAAGAAATANALAGEAPVAVLLAPRCPSTDIARARSSFTRLDQESNLRSGTILRGRLNRAYLDALVRSEAVLWVEPAPAMRLYDEVASKLVAGNGGPNKLLTQSLGYDGSGVKVAVADSGLNNGDAETMHPDLYGRTPAFFYYGGLTDAADEHSHGTHVSGIIAGNGATGEVDENGALYGLGVAPGASIITQRIFDGAGGYHAPPSFERLTRDAVRAGADIGSNSWGDDTQGRYDLSAMEFDELVRDADAISLGDQQYILEFSAGNAGSGRQTIGSPAVAKNVIATGASENDRTDFLIYGDGPDAMADFSSRGPCEDGRIKPDLVAPGTYISSLQSYSATADYAWAEISPNYQYQGGTSQAGPHVSGAAAVFVQYYRQTHASATPSPALVKAALINSALDMDDSFGTGPVPNMDEGWGRVDLTPIFDPAVGYTYQDQGPLLTNGAVFETNVLVGSSDMALMLTLAYTDVPGLPAAIPALVNDLDLEVVAPDGTLFRGNQFNGAESAPNPADGDRINNVEAVHLFKPLPGEYLVRVRAHRVVEDARSDTPAVDQDFALVVSGDLAAPGTGILSLDRGAYRVPDLVKIRLTDLDLAGQPSVTVNISSTTEASGEEVLLQAGGSSGVFTGAVATASGPAAVDGKLQVANGNTIVVRYYDASAKVTRSASARADFVPPVLASVTAVGSFGQVTVSWTSDEPASSLVLFGTNAATGITQSVGDATLETAHSIGLGRLDPGRTYYYEVVSFDEAGNVSTNNNGGAFYTFVVSPVPPVLLIDEDTDTQYQFAPPLSGYTDALNQVGLRYDVWDALTLGPPSLNTLTPYRAVIWRVPEFFGSWSDQEMGAISNYLHSGGSLLVSSMEVLTRLTDAGATNFIHDVLHVDSFVADSPDGVAEIIGLPYERMTSGLDIVMDYGAYELVWGGFIPSDVSDTITPGTNATSILHNSAGDSVGLRWPGLGQQAPGKLVLLTFPLDAVPLGTGVNDRANLLQNILSFLAPGASGAAEISLDSSAYNLPSMASVELAAPNRTGEATLTVLARSTSDPTGISVVLRQQGSGGTFAGSFNIQSATNPPASGNLAALNGDSLSVEYTEAAGGGTITASAVIDTTPPTISGVSSEPDYIEAVVAWSTTEPADSLVQFGESPILNRTAYSHDFSESHSLSLTGLVPDRTYYYRVVSRDAAGNAVVDDNHGSLYTFHTLLPVLTPWNDNLDTGAPGWTAYSEPLFDVGITDPVTWTLGKPQSELGPAHSPPNVWGVNLSGSAIDLADAFLISPAIYLTNGNVATLTYWQNYDFPLLSDTDIEFGTLYISANNGPLTELTGFGDSSYGWEQFQVDLTPYMGKVVFLVWEYFLFSMDSVPRPGWLIDDVAVTVQTTQPQDNGTIRIVNNLWHGGYLLSGPMSAKGSGSSVISNAPPGQYLLEFTDIPYYTTPSSQTNTLLPGGTVTFEGNYTFADSNSNGMSDAWEMQFFGVVSPYRTAATDTDGDGMTDLAEFLAGTDPNDGPRKYSLIAQQLSPTVLRLEWQSVPGQQYQIWSSSNWLSWQGVSGWLAATSTVTRIDVTLSPTGPPAYFRLQVWSANTAPGTLAPAPPLRLSTARAANGGIDLSWPASMNRGYRLVGSTNGSAWSPVSEWMPAQHTLETNTLPADAISGSRWLRLEVAP